MAESKTRVAAQRLYLTEDGRIVGDNDADKHVLLAAAGTSISDGQLGLLGISAEAFDAANQPAGEETDAAPAKASRGPRQNKARQAPAEEKGADANADNAQRTGGDQSPDAAEKAK